MAESGSPHSAKTTGTTGTARARSATGRELAVTFGIAVVLFAIVAAVTLALFGGGSPSTTSCR